MVLIIYIYNKHNFLFEIPTSDNPYNKKSKYRNKELYRKIVMCILDF